MSLLRHYIDPSYRSLDKKLEQYRRQRPEPRRSGNEEDLCFPKDPGSKNKRARFSSYLSSSDLSLVRLLHDRIENVARKARARLTLVALPPTLFEEGYRSFFLHVCRAPGIDRAKVSIPRTDSFHSLVGMGKERPKQQKKTMKMKMKKKTMMKKKTREQDSVRGGVEGALQSDASSSKERIHLLRTSSSRQSLARIVKERGRWNDRRRGMVRIRNDHERSFHLLVCVNSGVGFASADRWHRLFLSLFSERHGFDSSLGGCV